MREEWRRKLRRIPPQLLHTLSTQLYILSSEPIAVYDRLQLAHRLLDTLALLLWDYKPSQKHRELIQRKCGVEPPDGPLGPWILDQAYRDTREYMTRRYTRLKCIAEAAYAILTDLYTEA